MDVAPANRGRQEGDPFFTITRQCTTTREGGTCPFCLSFLSISSAQIGFLLLGLSPNLGDLLMHELAHLLGSVGLVQGPTPLRYLFCVTMLTPSGSRVLADEVAQPGRLLRTSGRLLLSPDPGTRGQIQTVTLSRCSVAVGHGDASGRHRRVGSLSLHLVPCFPLPWIVVYCYTSAASSIIMEIFAMLLIYSRSLSFPLFLGWRV